MGKKVDRKFGVMKYVFRNIKRLNEEGKTVILVTHERDIARYADNVITMKDGRVKVG